MPSGAVPRQTGRSIHPRAGPSAFGVTDPDDANWLSQRLLPQPLRTFTEVTRLTGAVDQIPGTAIYCRPQVYPFEQLAKEIGYRTVVIDGPHDVMLTRPHELAALLLDVRLGRMGRQSAEGRRRDEGAERIETATGDTPIVSHALY
jgi:hypothetical protein